MTSPAAPAPNVDWAGVAHPRAESPRIACLVPSLTEALFALRLGERVVARTGFCVHPRMEVRRVPKVEVLRIPTSPACANSLQRTSSSISMRIAATSSTPRARSFRM